MLSEDHAYVSPDLRPDPDMALNGSAILSFSAFREGDFYHAAHSRA